ncbi:immunity protein Imm33 domain-containing protein [Polycladospora coralii]|uniref:immunity protein Imm33 domain-containing protein n=1 Tax=Polycladospora coralii TaxID=2771432 RepID=UPI0034E1EAA2
MEFLNDSTNFQILSLGVVLNIDDAIQSFFDDNPLCAYERNNEGLLYKIKNYDWKSYL